MIKHIKSSGHSAFIKVNVNGVDAKFLVDSGAAVTVISSKLYGSMDASLRPPLVAQLENIQLQAADNGILNVHGTVELNIVIEDETFVWNAYVADISDDGLLGFDFMHYYNCSLEARRGLRVNNRLFKCDIMSEMLTCPVFAKFDTVIPANSEFVVAGEIQNVDLVNGSTNAVIEPIYSGATVKQLHVAACLVDATRNDIDLPVRVANIQNEDVHLFKGTRIATLHPVDNVYERSENEDKTSYVRVCGVKASDLSDVELPFDGWPDDLKALYEQSCGGMQSQCEKNRLAALLAKHKHTFATSSSDLGRTSLVQHTIDTGDAQPIKQRPRRPPRAFIDEEEKIIETQLQSGVIRESTSAWASPLVYVKKRDGSTRPCVDYRKLNEVTKKDAYPLPRIEDCLDCLGGAKMFSTLDLQSGYWQIEIKEEDRHKTAFSTRSGHYEYVTMPFGLCNAPSTFERAMELIMRGLQWKSIMLYLDDIIVMSSNFEEHVERLDEVLGRLGKVGLKLKPSKCSLFQSEVSYLGHVVSERGIKPDPEKVDRVHEWPTPTSVSDVRSFLGLCSYYRRFIRGFSTIAAPLNKLLEKSSSLRVGR